LPGELGSPSSPLTFEDAMMSPQWRGVKHHIERMTHELQEAEKGEGGGENIGGDQLSLLNIDADTRKEMLVRQSKVIHKIVDQQIANSAQEADLLGGVDSWMVAASHKLVQGDEDDGSLFSSAPVRANAVVGQLLNQQTELGNKMKAVHSQQNLLIANLRQEKQAGDVALVRLAELEEELKNLNERCAKKEEMLREQTLKHDKAFHASRMQQVSSAAAATTAKSSSSTFLVLPFP
jgi:hypothetical protein